ncbi:MAG: NAD(P)/FAD-dependent oxidoreductase [Acidobacteriota bacterium]
MESFDVAVVGGGPAGATLSMRLAGYGLPVCLLDKGMKARQHVGETLPASMHSMLQELGLSHRLDEAAARRPPRHWVIWGRKERRLVPLDEGCFVWRGPFDRLLLDAARERGVVVRSGVSVIRFDRRGSRVDGASGEPRSTCVHYLDGDGNERALLTRLVADASGRSGVLARRFRQREGRFQTVALTGHWSGGEDTEATVIEALPQGWVWSAPLGNGLRDVTLMLDREAVWGGPHTIYRSALTSAPETIAMLRGASLARTPRAVDATSYTSRRFAGLDFVLLGDAASFLDPLSAHGVHKAMDSAMTAAVVAHTILGRPPVAGEDAVHFYNRRQAALYEVAKERLGELYRQETRWPREVFWTKRQAQGRRVGKAGRLSLAGPRSPLRPEMRLRPAPGCRLGWAPVLEDNFIERREVVMGPTEPAGVRFWRGACLPDLFRRAVEGERTVAEAARGAAVGFPKAVKALAWLYRSGFLIER